MATPAVLDFEALLRPISEEEPPGVNLREDFTPGSIYFKIKDVRTAARAAERRNDSRYLEEGASVEVVDWSPILEAVPEILGEKSKDLEFTAWLIEALVRAHGFAGLRDGFRLARELIETYWDDLYPRPDEDGLMTRIAPLTGLNGEGTDGTLIAPIARVPITAAGSYGPFSSWDHAQADELAAIDDPERRDLRIQAGGVTQEMFQTAVAESDASYFKNLIEDLEQCMAEYATMCAVLDSRCGADGPPTTNIRKALETVRDTVGFLTKDILAVEPEQEGEEGEEGVTLPDGAREKGTESGGPLESRADAFRALEQVARFFRRTEPHSPISYTLDQVVRWGRLSLPELIQELILDDNARSSFCQLTGVRQPDSAD